VPRGSGGLFRLALRPGSGPAFDDAVYAFVPPPPRLRVGVVADGGPGPFLRAALEVAGPLLDAEGSGTLPPDRLADVAGTFDLLILAGTDPPADLPPGDYLLLTDPPAALGLTALPPVESAPVWEQSRRHPVTRGVDTAEVVVVNAAPARLPEGAEAILSVPAGAVAAAGEKDGVRYVWIGLDPGNSTLPVTGAYPLLIRNTLRWFASLATEPLPPAVPSGDPVTPVVPLPPGTGAIAARGPGDADSAVLPVIGGSFQYRPDGAGEGEVTVRIGGRDHRTHVNAIIPEESSRAPTPGEPSPAPDRRKLRDTEERLWSLFAAAAAAFLLLQWVLHTLTKSG